MPLEFTQRMLNFLPARARVEWMQRKRARELEKNREEPIRRRAAIAEDNRGLAAVREMEDGRALEERLRRAQMESAGTLAGTVAHDFNNILNIIQGYSSLIAAHSGENA